MHANRTLSDSPTSAQLFSFAGLQASPAFLSAFRSLEAICDRVTNNVKGNLAYVRGHLPPHNGGKLSYPTSLPGSVQDFGLSDHSICKVAHLRTLFARLRLDPYLTVALVPGRGTSHAKHPDARRTLAGVSRFRGVTPSCTCNVTPETPES